MKVRSVLSVLVALAPMIACAATDDGFYADGSFGRGAESSYDPTTNVVNLDVGYRWSWFGVEAGYVDFKRTNRTVFLDPVPLAFGSRESGFTAGVAGHWNVASDWYLSARAGAFFWRDAMYESMVGGKSFPARSDGTSWYAGVGFGYDFTKNFSLGASYDLYDADSKTAKVPSLKAEVRF